MCISAALLAAAMTLTKKAHGEKRLFARSSSPGPATSGTTESGHLGRRLFLAYTYDGAHRLVRIADAFDERIDYTLDALGNRTLEQIHGPGGAALAKTQSRVFDALGRLFHSIGAAG
jgi:hypothetical protein